MARPNSQRLVPIETGGEPVVEPLRRLVRWNEELHLHLLELTRTEDEVPGSDLVAERLADLCDAKRRLLARKLEHVLEVDEDALGSFWTQVDRGSGFFDGTHGRLEHQVEVTGLGQVTFAVLSRALRGLLAAVRRVHVVSTKAELARSAVDHRVGESGEVPGRLPRFRMHQDCGVERDDHVVLLEHLVPPA